MPEVETTDKDETDTDDDAQPGDANINNEGNGNNNGKPGNGHGNGNNGNNGNGNKPTTTPDPVEPEPVDPDPDVPETPDTPEPGNNGNGNGNNGNDGNGNSAGNNGQGNGNNASNGDGNGSINKTSTVVKNFVVDYNTETFEPLMEHEVNGLDYKYVYGNDRLSVDISPINNSMSIVENGDHIRLYYHMDYLGSADYLTSPVSGRVEAWTHYNEWGLIVHNAVLKCGQRELDLVKRYATHDFDSVLEMYYAKARFYDAHDRRFTAVDPILDPSGYDLREYVENPVQLVQYLYVGNNPVLWIDRLGLYYIYKHTDKNGKPYYTITDQSWFDATISTFLNINPQVIGHEVFTGGSVIDGTSWSPPSIQTQIETLYAAEIQQFEANLAAVPYGPQIIFGYEIITGGITAVVDFPKSIDITKRDNIILQIMKDAGISTKSYSENFRTAAVAADFFVQDYSWLFVKEPVLGNKTQYEIGKMLKHGINNKAVSKAKSKIYSAYYNMYHDQLLSMVTSLDPGFYADYRARHNRNYPSQVMPTLKWSDIGRKELLWPVSTHDVADYLANLSSKEFEKMLINNYEVVIKYFQEIFCEN